MSRSMPNMPKPTPLRFSALSSGWAALVCAAVALPCAVAPCGAVMAQTADPQAQAATAPATAPAPTPAPQPRKKRNPTGSPLDTLMSTRLFADVPEAKDFVRETRRSPIPSSSSRRPEPIPSGRRSEQKPSLMRCRASLRARLGRTRRAPGCAARKSPRRQWRAPRAANRESPKRRCRTNPQPGFTHVE